MLSNLTVLWTNVKSVNEVIVLSDYEDVAENTRGDAASVTESDNEY